MTVESSVLHQFGAFRLDCAARQLFRDGAVVPIASKAMDVLLILVGNAGQVIERGELIKRIWPDSEGADGSLAVTVSALRKTLGDRPDGGSYIETLPRQGYRFTALVTTKPEGSMPTGVAVATPDEGVLLKTVERANKRSVGTQADDVVLG